ncbi:MAG: DUF2140 family protein [Andreesenia angusta]|nr:DUF2140 family protein [Andreesenia angusta]
MKERKINLWKWAFLILIFSILISIIYILIRLNNASNYSEYMENNEITNSTEIDNSLRFETKFTEDQFNELLKTVLMDEKNSYQIYFDKEVHFLGKLEILERKLPFEIKGRPKALKNGNIMVNISNIEAGGFDLPKNLILKAFAIIIPKDIPMKIDLEKGNIIINLIDISKEQGLLIKAKNIDSLKDDYTFEINIPKTMID